MAWPWAVLAIIAGVAIARSVWTYTSRGHGDARSIFVLFGYCAISILWYFHARRSRIIEVRKVAGACPACGYDLTGNVSGTCPECGEKVGDGA
ncbi:MAG TPA: hypothetical protein VG269_15940 [Tepidisphaeraceae bacterium]|nr:hypothetical protein [Tepidisphaeraceae bacterium]